MLNRLALLFVTALIGCGPSPDASDDCPAFRPSDYVDCTPATGVVGTGVAAYVTACGMEYVGIWLERNARYRVEGSAWICDPYAYCPVAPATPHLAKAYCHPRSSVAP